MMPIPPRNPYIAGKALATDQGFFGRADILRVVETELADHQRNAIVLFGQRRIGKTSILLQLQRRLAVPRFLPVVFDLQDRATQPLGRLLADLAHLISEELGLEHEKLTDFDDLGLYFQKTFLPRLYQALQPDQRPILLFDEFDVLDVVTEERLAANSAALAFFPYLRSLLRSEPRLGFVFVLGRRISDLSSHFWSTFKTARHQRVSVLDSAATHELITSAERNGTLRFAPEAVAAISALTSGHPYLTQLVCQIVWDTAYYDDPTEPPLITVAAVDAAAEQALDAGNNVFVWIWNGLPPAERIIAAAIAEATEHQPEISEQQLSDLLQSQGARILVNELTVAPETLVEWELLRKTATGYRFLVELLRRWVVLNKPLAQVREEIDLINPLADRLYRVAEAYYDRQNLERAQAQLVEALSANPNMLRARLLLGQVLLEQGQFSQALREFEEAYRYDPTVARLPLVRALLAYGEERERAGAELEALDAYTRVLVLSPRERVARDRKAALLVRAGEQWLGAGEYDLAEQAFREAGDQERVQKVMVLRLLARREALVSAAEQAERMRAWEEARNQYQQLATIEPDEPRWKEALQRITTEGTLARLYEEGKAAMQRLDWQAARHAFATLIARMPDYEDAAELLAQVVRHTRGETPPEGRSAGQVHPENGTSPGVFASEAGGQLEANQLAAQDVHPDTEQAVTKRSRLRTSILGLLGILGLIATLIVGGRAVLTQQSMARILVGFTLERELVGAGTPVQTLAYTASGSVLASGNADGSLTLWDTTNGTMLTHTDPAIAIQALSWSSDGSILAVARADGRLQIFNWKTELTEQFSSSNNGSRIVALAWSPTEPRLLATGAADGLVQLWRWDASSSPRLTNVMHGTHPASISRVVFSTDGGLLASSSTDGNLYVWNVRTNQQQAAWDLGSNAVQGMVFAPNTAELSAIDSAGRLYAITNTVRSQANPAGQPASSVSFSPTDTGLRLVGLQNGQIEVWREQQRLGTIGVPGEAVQSMAFRPDGQRVAVARGNTIQIWRVP